MRIAPVLALCPWLLVGLLVCGHAAGQLVIPPPPEERAPDLSGAGGASAGVPPQCSLVKRGSDGRIQELAEPAEVAALRKNPLVTPAQRAQADALVAERRAIFRRLAIENLDLVEQIDGGLFERIDLRDRGAFSRLVDVAKPLKPSDIRPLSRSLEERSMLTHEQAVLNDRIAQEYKTLRAMQDSGGQARRSLALMYKQGLDEPLAAIRSARLAAAARLPTLIPRLGLDPATARALEQVATGPAEDEASRLDMLARVNQKLSLEQRQQLLRLANPGR